MADLKPAEVDMCKLHFEIYDTFAEGKMDAADLGSLMRSLDLRPTEAMIEKAGGAKNRGEKKLTVEEVMPIYSQLKKEKDMGTLNDFIEGLKVYDKLENGTLMAAELSHVLLSLGEVMTDREVDEVMAACSGPQDEEGFIKYEHFAKTLLAGPYPEKK
ncbi:myosin light chain alkali-like [Tropilaelaps mercedesae]|uniref:Myosin light chain alkali-like n=1 Tax=Tropilaelaps mercedesae TaxID=418985 RepID=A0A1V9Y369_9ACAR|nr:myosin light chain alkali-like [Tropilaelaps mercedesae]